MTSLCRGKLFRPACWAILAVCGVAVTLPAQVKEHPIPQVVKKDGRYAFMVDGAPFLMLGAQAHNSSGWPNMLPKVWPAIEYLHANTLEIPIYWEQFEPKPGQFDYSVIDTIVTQAREHHVRLDLLWFGTWKNGSQHYMPEWMKAEPDRYFHVIDKNGRPADSPSPFATAAQELDIKAFSAFLRHLKAFDPVRTVIMVQVENETGTWGSTRDYGAAAQKAFEGPVPADVLKAMNVQGSPANWQDAFGVEAEVNFHAWAVATYVGKVAAAGKAVYPLPLYANAALRDPLKPGAPGSYEAGGPTDNVIPIWKVAAPAVDIVCPDIYLNDPAAYLKVLELYHRDDNPLFVPETSGGAPVARFFFSALGLQTIGFSPFGLDYSSQPFPPTAPAAAGAPAGAAREPQDALAPTAQNYKMIAGMMREVARLNYEGKLQTAVEEKGTATDTLKFGAWNATVSYGAGRRGAPAGNADPTGRVLVAQLGDNQFLVTGYSARVDFRPAEANKRRQFMRVDEGTYENGAFKFLRILNGDETDNGLNFRSEPVALRVSLGTY
jgi:beta-galactosidase GanA